MRPVRAHRGRSRRHLSTRLARHAPVKRGKELGACHCEGLQGDLLHLPTERLICRGERYENDQQYSLAADEPRTHRFSPYVVNMAILEQDIDTRARNRIIVHAVYSVIRATYPIFLGTQFMATFNPRIFTNPARLKEIDPGRLISFLSKWSSYFVGRGLDLTAVDTNEMPYDEIASILMTPDTDVSDTMVNALYYVHETANNEPMEELIERAEAAGLGIQHDNKSTPADVAVQIWLIKPDLLERQHAETVAFNRSNFMYFAGQVGKKAEVDGKVTITEAQCREMERLMDPWFEKKRRGRGSRVFVFPHGSKIWILVRHGMPMRREGEHKEDGKDGIAFYRPQKDDVLIYDADADEIGINAGTKGERNLYLETIGAVVFGDTERFDFADRYHLQPLLDHGQAALACADIPGLAGVRLVEFGRIWDGKVPEHVVHRSDDLFATYGENWAARLRMGKLTYAKFKVSFIAEKKERSVMIRLANIARYDRDSDASLLEAWLKARGFWKTNNDGDGNEDFEVLESA